MEGQDSFTSNGVEYHGLPQVEGSFVLERQQLSLGDLGDDPMIFLDSGGRGHTKEYHDVVDDLSVGDIPFPDPVDFGTYEDFFRATQEWKKDVRARLDMFEYPVSVGGVEPTVLESIFDSDFFMEMENNGGGDQSDPDSQSEEVQSIADTDERKVFIDKINRFFLGSLEEQAGDGFLWETLSVPVEPLPEWFGSYNDFYSAYTRWAEIVTETTNYVPPHPSQLRNIVWINTGVSDKDQKAGAPEAMPGDLIQWNTGAPQNKFEPKYQKFSWAFRRRDVGVTRRRPPSDSYSPTETEIITSTELVDTIRSTVTKMLDMDRGPLRGRYQKLKVLKGRQKGKHHLAYKKIFGRINKEDEGLFVLHGEKRSNESNVVSFVPLIDTSSNFVESTKSKTTGVGVRAFRNLAPLCTWSNFREYKEPEDTDVFSLILSGDVYVDAFEGVLAKSTDEFVRFSIENIERLVELDLPESNSLGLTKLSILLYDYVLKHRDSSNLVPFKFGLKTLFKLISLARYSSLSEVPFMDYSLFENFLEYARRTDGMGENVEKILLYYAYRALQDPALALNKGFVKKLREQCTHISVSIREISGKEFAFYLAENMFHGSGCISVPSYLVLREFLRFSQQNNIPTFTGVGEGAFYDLLLQPTRHTIAQISAGRIISYLIEQKEAFGAHVAKHFANAKTLGGILKDRRSGDDAGGVREKDSLKILPDTVSAYIGDIEGLHSGGTELVFVSDIFLEPPKRIESLLGCMNSIVDTLDKESEAELFTGTFLAALSEETGKQVPDSESVALLLLRLLHRLVVYHIDHGSRDAIPRELFSMAKSKVQEPIGDWEVRHLLLRTVYDMYEANMWNELESFDFESESPFLFFVCSTETKYQNLELGWSLLALLLYNSKNAIPVMLKKGLLQKFITISRKDPALVAAQMRFFWKILKVDPKESGKKAFKVSKKVKSFVIKKNFYVRINSVFSRFSNGYRGMGFVEMVKLIRHLTQDKHFKSYVKKLSKNEVYNRGINEVLSLTEGGHGGKRKKRT